MFGLAIACLEKHFNYIVGHFMYVAMYKGVNLSISIMLGPALCFNVTIISSMKSCHSTNDFSDVGFILE